MAETAIRQSTSVLERLNEASPDQFIALLGAIVEHSPWVAEAAASRRPFSTIDLLHQTMMQIVAEAPPEQKLALIQAHPELAGREAVAGEMTPASTSEQTRLGLDRLPAEEFDEISRLNRTYRERFGFPCIVALRLHQSRREVLREMERRLVNDRATEIGLALEQISYIARGRLQKLVEGGTV
ncbi:MAG TPA: 2-oxo-4-hydroxy-4-carboxy-5-ureidoimidazoline decarboxylase [Rhabdaerophilum sp.]|nr:2-oxo-4-hydroxy-4-carboxy-5-ureidoimidazoline decarboxylase [Rhabdaerophilum sp.]